LSQDDTQTLSVRPRSVKNRRIIPSRSLVVGLFVTAVILVPLMGLLTALGLWWRRR
jgi:ABC-type uncharacterized transport system involved in gliding motility auxiliary subunit